jgi:hypothetical protein
MLLTKASSIPERRRLPSVVTGEQVRPEGRVSAVRLAARAATGRVLQPLPRYRKALLKAEAVLEAMRLRIRETPEVNRAGSTGSILSDNKESRV